MQKFMNNPNKMVEESLSGFAKCHAESVVRPSQNLQVLKYKHAPIAGKVGIVTGGGSGHNPAFIGYIGMNMLDAVAAGQIFVPPSAEEFYAAFKCADSGNGVACLFGNYERDNANVQKAIEMAAKDNITVKTVVSNDDVASAPAHKKEKRRGISGEVFMWKIGGAAAAKGMSLDEVIAVSQKAVDNTRSFGVGLSSCIIPLTGRPNYSIEEGTMEVGVGHHGDPSLDVCKLKPASGTADIMLDATLCELRPEKSDELVVMISGLGATTLMEQYILYDRIHDRLVEQGIKIYRSFVGDFFTSLDMMGASLTLMKLDSELKELLDYPADGISFKRF